jgi:hypothetical protein
MMMDGWMDGAGFVFLWRGIIVALAFLGKSVDCTFCVTDTYVKEWFRQSLLYRLDIGTTK